LINRPTQADSDVARAVLPARATDRAATLISRATQPGHTIGRSEPSAQTPAGAGRNASGVAANAADSASCHDRSGVSPAATQADGDSTE